MYLTVVNSAQGYFHPLSILIHPPNATIQPLQPPHCLPPFVYFICTCIIYRSTPPPPLNSLYYTCNSQVPTPNSVSDPGSQTPSSTPRVRHRRKPGCVLLLLSLALVVPLRQSQETRLRQRPPLRPFPSTLPSLYYISPLRHRATTTIINYGDCEKEERENERRYRKRNIPTTYNSTSTFHLQPRLPNTYDPTPTYLLHHNFPPQPSRQLPSA